jgi:hypothetical protein
MLPSFQALETVPDRLLNTNSSSALIRTAGFNYPLGRRCNC